MGLVHNGLSCRHQTPRQIMQLVWQGTVSVYMKHTYRRIRGEGIHCRERIVWGADARAEERGVETKKTPQGVLIVSGSAEGAENP
jgi:hypothetical protein